jgi:hypothetical protein
MISPVAILRDARDSALPRMTSVYVAPEGNHPSPDCVVSDHRRFAMRVFLGMILGALLLVAGVYMYDSMQTSTVASGGQVAQANRTIVNWEVAASDWNALKRRAHDDWIKLSSK